MQYPVTKEEIIQVLENILQQERDKMAIGGLDCMILQDLVDAAKSNPNWVTDTFHGKLGYIN